MKRTRTHLFAGAILAACLAALSGRLGVPGRAEILRAESLPPQLSDGEFWKLSAELSEPNGSFRFDNLLSNELYFQYVIPDLIRTAKPDRAYMGVGPEQNFTYIAALKPKMAFIVDVRRANLDLHLMYKALFELSADRAEFLSRLFSKKRPGGLTAKSTVTDILAAYWDIGKSEPLYEENLKAVFDQLSSRHRFALSEEDRQGIEYVYDSFFRFGALIQYSSSSGPGAGFGVRGGSSQPTYADLLVAVDEAGQMHGYLASEDNFAFLKQLETKNLVVPVVGNFAGPKAIRAVGRYLKDNEATVSAFYLSNVEQYLLQDGIWRDFCANVASLPLDDTSTFIRAARGGRYGPGFGLSSELGSMAKQVSACTNPLQR